MRTTLYFDLRQRVTSKVAAGATCREAAEHFGVSRASASRSGLFGAVIPARQKHWSGSTAPAAGDNGA